MTFLDICCYLDRYIVSGSEPVEHVMGHEGLYPTRVWYQRVWYNELHQLRINHQLSAQTTSACSNFKTHTATTTSHCDTQSADIQTFHDTQSAHVCTEQSTDASPHNKTQSTYRGAFVETKSIADEDCAVSTARRSDQIR